MEPVIVTAFWDVGRGDNCLLPRTNERYYREFSEWARIRNRLIVYTDKQSEDTVKKIRNGYGLLDRTIVVVIEDIFSVENSLYEKMKTVEKDPEYLASRFRPDAMETRANFDYAWMLKYWAIADSRKYISKDDIIAWFDFGFNHINACYSDMSEFDFLWTLEQPIDKIKVYSLKDINDVNVFNSLQFQSDNIMGVFYLLPASMAPLFWKYVREAAVALLEIQCIDDDQQLVLMACKSHPEAFDVHVSDRWYLALKENGANHLTVLKHINNVKPTMKARIDHKGMIAKRMILYLKRSKKLADKYIQK